MKFVTSWDDGSKHDLRLSKLLKKYNIPATFYIPSNCELSEDDIKKLFKEDFDIGCHTANHPSDLKVYDFIGQEREILLNKLWLENLIGKDIKKFCYPRGRYNDITIDVLKGLGFKEARTTVTGCTDLPDDKFRVKTSVHVYPKTPKFGKPDWEAEAYKLYNKAKDKGSEGYFYIWGHSHELQRYQLWDDLEKFLKFVNKDTI